MHVVGSVGTVCIKSLIKTSSWHLDEKCIYLLKNFVYQIHMKIYIF